MSRPDDAAFAEFFTQWHHKLVMSFLRQGTHRPDAEDAAQAVLMATFERWSTIRHPNAYFRQAMRNELAAMRRRQQADLVRAVGWAGRRGELSAADVYHRDEADIVRDCLTILPPRQREVVAWLYEGHQPDEIAEALGSSPATVRSNRRHAHTMLAPFLVGNGHELRRWMRSGERAYEAFHRGETLPLVPRPVISWAWKLAKDLRVDPERGAEVAPLSRDEVKHRRQESPIAGRPWVLTAMGELAATTGQMMVIADADSVVLWRGGAREVLDAADLLGFVEGASWDMKHAGVNGIALALMIGATVTVSRWEHYVRTQHGLSCVAASVLDPRDRRVLCALNLTGTRATVPHAIQRQVDTIALRLRQQLARPAQPSPGHNGAAAPLPLLDAAHPRCGSACHRQRG